MLSTVQTPHDHAAVTPYLLVRDAARLLDFLAAAFGGEEVRRDLRSDGRVRHAEVRISGAIIMAGEPGTDWDPLHAANYRYVADTTATHRRAIEAGALALLEPTTLPEGDDMSAIRDPSGNVWWLTTRNRSIKANR